MILDDSAKDFWRKQILILIMKFAEQASISSMNDLQDTQDDRLLAAIQSRVLSFQNDYMESVQLLLDK